MLQSSENVNGVRSTSQPPTLTLTTLSKPPPRPSSKPRSDGRWLLRRNQRCGSALYRWRIEGKITLTDNRVTVGRNGTVQADITAREVVVMGKVTGNIECSDRVDIRSEGVVNGNVSTTASAWKMARCSRAAFRLRAVITNTSTSRSLSRKLPKRRSPRQSRRRRCQQPPAFNCFRQHSGTKKGYAGACPFHSACPFHFCVPATGDSYRAPSPLGTSTIESYFLSLGFKSRAAEFMQ